MSERIFPGGTKMFFGAPAKPMADVMADAIGQVVAQVPGICEAYIPQCFIEGDTEARQVLVVGVEKKEKIPEVMQDLMSKMKLLLPPRRFHGHSAVSEHGIAGGCSCGEVPHLWLTEEDEAVVEVLAVKTKRPNKAPEPTSLRVTPRARRH